MLEYGTDSSRKYATYILYEAKKNVKLKEGESFCDECGGTGQIEKKYRCSKCRGHGKLDWIDKVLGKKVKTNAC